MPDIPPPTMPSISDTQNAALRKLLDGLRANPKGDGISQIITADNLRQVLFNHGLSHAQYAGLMGVSITTVSNWMTGRQRYLPPWGWLTKKMFEAKTPFEHEKLAFIRDERIRKMPYQQKLLFTDAWGEYFLQQADAILSGKPPAAGNSLAFPIDPNDPRLKK